MSRSFVRALYGLVIGHTKLSEQNMSKSDTDDDNNSNNNNSNIYGGALQINCERVP